MKIGIDFDGCLVDNRPVWRQYYAKELCGREHDYTALERDDDWHQFPKACAECWRHCITEAVILEAHAPRPGVRAALAALATNFSIYVVTSRSPDVAASTWRWLHRYGLMASITDVIHTSDKGAAGATLGLSVHLDDSPDDIASVMQAGIVPVVFDAPYNTTVEAARVHDWGEVLAVIYGAYGRLMLMYEEQLRYANQSVGQA